MDTSSKKPLGEILIEAGLISIYQLELALHEQRQEQNNLKIGEILVAHGWIKQETIDFFCGRWFELLETKEKKPLVYYLQEANLIDDEAVEAVMRLKELKSQKVRFHRLAVEQGYLKQTTIDFFLAHLFKIYDPKTISVTKPYQILKSYTEGERNFSKTNLRKVPLMSISLKEIILDGSNLRKADLSQANLSHSSLVRTNLKLANFKKAILTAVNFSKSSLTQANLQEAHLEKANFKDAILLEVDFRGAYLAQADFSGADLTTAKLPSEYPYEVYYDKYTSFPQDFDAGSKGWKLTCQSR